MNQHTTALWEEVCREKDGRKKRERETKEGII